VFVAEREGRVRILRNGVLDPRSAIVIDEVLMTTAGDGGLLALTLDAQFDRTHFVYAAYTTLASQGPRQFRLVRYREVDGRFGERVVLLDAVPTAAKPAVALGVGPDGRLYVAFDAAGNGNGGRVPTQASYSGKILRLNTDGTTPQDQASDSPVVVGDLYSPRGIDWQPSSNSLWVADAKRPDFEELRIVGAGSRNGAGRLRLPPGTGAASLTFYRGTLLPGLSGDLLVAAAEGRHLLRMRLDKRDPAKVISTEHLLEDAGSPVRAVASSSDGTIYAATDRRLVRLGPL